MHASMCVSAACVHGSNVLLQKCLHRFVRGGLGDGTRELDLASANGVSNEDM